MRYYEKDLTGLDVSVIEEEKARIRARKREERAKRYTGMHTVMPIEEAEMIRKWLRIAKEHDAKRTRGGASWYLLLMLGFNTGLRIGDLVKLRVKDVRGRERVNIVQEKTGKTSDMLMQAGAVKAIEEALIGKDENDFVLTSRQKGIKDGREKPISRQRAYAIIKEIAKRSGFAERVGCHTLRKTFAWQYYQAASGDLTRLQEVLNHSSQAATIHYLGLDRKAKDEPVEKMVRMW